MPHNISKIKDDLSAVSQFSCFVGHPVIPFITLAIQAIKKVQWTVNTLILKCSTKKKFGGF